MKAVIGFFVGVWFALSVLLAGFVFCPEMQGFLRDKLNLNPPAVECPCDPDGDVCVLDFGHPGEEGGA